MLGHYIVKATHGSDVGIWVCEASGILISPFLFIQAVCPARFPRSVTVKRQPSASPPRSFKKSEELSLIYGECGRLPSWQSYVHLFSIGIPAARPFERECVLADWQFPVRIGGAVVTFDKRSDDAAGRLAYRLQSALNPSTQSRNRTLAWVKAQGIPFVVAALGYDAGGFAEDKFRRRFGVPPDCPIVTGPALADESPRDTASPGGRSIISWPLMGGRKVRFAAEYARQVLGALCKLIETQQSLKEEGPQ
jgi:hypothetical protein